MSLSLCPENVSGKAQRRNGHAGSYPLFLRPVVPRASIDATTSHMRNLLVCSMLAASLLGVGCGGEDEEEKKEDPTAARATKILALTPNTTAGQTVYSMNCVTCHGADGRGVTNFGTSLVDGLAKDPSGRQPLTTVLTGVPNTLMVSFAALSDQQLKAGHADAPWPPHHAKHEGEGARVAPSRKRRGAGSAK